MVLIAPILGQCLPFTPFLPVDLSLDLILTHFIVPLVRRDRRIYSWKSGNKDLDSYPNQFAYLDPTLAFFIFLCWFLFGSYFVLFGAGVSCRILYSIIACLSVSCYGSITFYCFSMGKGGFFRNYCSL